ncbi:MAG: hypothetical protein MPJ06_00880 [Nitrosopumilus sp.]|nr:hypothetical protein [Nitrosopumilus sp.]MDA7942552.1 hypothetical protein [Nitrosopumilus sp.]
MMVEPEGTSARGRLKELIFETGAFDQKEEKFRLASGRLSNFYFDLKRLGGHPEGLHMAARALYEHIRAIPNIQSVGGLESGSISLASAVSLLSYLNRSDDPRPISSFYVRKIPKKYGTKKRIEGNPGHIIVVVDDVITSGKSALQAVDAMKKEKHECVSLMCIVFRGSDEDRKRIEAEIKFEPLFLESDFTSSRITRSNSI